jgi:hypothetical protein
MRLPFSISKQHRAFLFVLSPASAPTHADSDPYDVAGVVLLDRPGQREARGSTTPRALGSGPARPAHRLLSVAIAETPAPPLRCVRSDGDRRTTNTKAREEATHRKPRRRGGRRGR